MRETRLSGLEGGGAVLRSPYPYLIHRLFFRIGITSSFATQDLRTFFTV